MRSPLILVIQLVLVAASVAAVSLWLVAFPYPSPLVRSLLPPKARWPAAQVEQWAEGGSFAPEFLTFFARDPERRIPRGNNVVSPSDGLLQIIRTDKNKTFVVIGLSFWDVHVVRSPASGTVQGLESDGSFFPRYPSRSEVQRDFFIRGKAAPVQKIVELHTGVGVARVRLITSYWASRIKVWVFPGEAIGKGQRLGRILLGSTVVLELPGHPRLLVHVGQRVVGGETILCSQLGQ